MTAKKKNKIRDKVQRVKDRWANFKKNAIGTVVEKTKFKRTTFKEKRPVLSSRNIGIAFLVILALFLIIWLFPKWQVVHLEQLSPEKLFKLENEARKTIAQGLGGILVLFGLYIANMRVMATEAQVRAIEEGQVTDRFTRAIDQLGNKDSMEVRLGGIYALERIGKDSPKDRNQIIEVLTAYIRNNAGKENSLESKEDEKKGKKFVNCLPKLRLSSQF